MQRVFNRHWESASGEMTFWKGRVESRRHHGLFEQVRQLLVQVHIGSQVVDEIGTCEIKRKEPLEAGAKD